jgi:hypothetical protein
VRKTAVVSAPPVALFVFNRPHMTARVMEILRVVRPPRLLVVADGPRPGHPDDPATCDSARRVAQDVDWPCEVTAELADHNLGCDRRLLSGLDWVFSTVERAIILEDDVVPDPSFFGWCEAMLDRYAGDRRVAMVSGRNEIGRWGPSDASHLLVRHGSVWGWATWADAWRRTAAVIDGFDDRSRAVIAERELEPLFREHVEVIVDHWLSPTGLGWDMKVMGAMVLQDAFCAVSAVNLVRNIGCGPEATRTTNPDDLAATISTWTAGGASDRHPVEPDPTYDRWATMAFLLSSYLDPDRVLRMAKFSTLLAAQLNDTFAVGSIPIQHALVPARSPDEARRLLAHLRRVSEASTSLDRLDAAFGVRSR